MSESIRLIAGLGNPGPQYEATRHNAGFWFLEALARRAGGSFRSESKFGGESCRVTVDGRELWLLKPMTFMNRSGAAVAALARFYKIAPEEILVAHDELDLPPGGLKLKQGGGHAGHNGLRDIQAQLGSKSFLRLRIGIGRPEQGSEVVGFVLRKPPAAEREAVGEAIEEAIDALPLIVAGELGKAMNRLHSRN